MSERPANGGDVSGDVPGGDVGGGFLTELTELAEYFRQDEQDGQDGSYTQNHEMYRDRKRV